MMSMTSKKFEVAKSATDALKMLWRNGFFRKWQTQPKIAAHLAEIEHNFAGPELGMALKRAKCLTRRGKRGSYEYIQKYPSVAGEPVARGK
jgi:hypothetical protein